MHTNDRPYICKCCNRGFMRSTTLKVHLRIHSGERPYVCPYPDCGKTFTESGNLNTHKKLHTGEQPSKTRGQSKKSKKKQEIVQITSAFTPYRSTSEPPKLEIQNRVQTKIEELQTSKITAFTNIKKTEMPFNGYAPSISKETGEMTSLNCSYIYPYQSYGILIGNSIVRPLPTPVQSQEISGFPAFCIQESKTATAFPYSARTISSQSLDGKIPMQFDNTKTMNKI